MAKIGKRGKINELRYPKKLFVGLTVRQWEIIQSQCAKYNTGYGEMLRRLLDVGIDHFLKLNDLKYTKKAELNPRKQKEKGILDDLNDMTDFDDSIKRLV